MKKTYKAPFVLGLNLKETLSTLSYDFYMFIQLVLFYFVALSVGNLCYLLGNDAWLNKFTSIIEKIGSVSQKK